MIEVILNDRLGKKVRFKYLTPTHGCWLQLGAFYVFLEYAVPVPIVETLLQRILQS